MNKSVIITILVFVILIAVDIFFNVQKILSDYNSTNISIRVITEDEQDQTKEYWGINNHDREISVKKFKADDTKTYYLYNCYDSSIKDDGIRNDITDNCVMYDENKNIIQKNNEIEKIISLVANTETHSITSVKILDKNGNYYVRVRLNVNLWCPYELYYFDKDNNKLKLIHTFSEKDVVGIKTNE